MALGRHARDSGTLSSVRKDEIPSQHLTYISLCISVTVCTKTSDIHEHCLNLFSVTVKLIKQYMNICDGFDKVI